MEDLKIHISKYASNRTTNKITMVDDYVELSFLLLYYINLLLYLDSFKLERKGLWSSINVMCQKLSEARITKYNLSE